MMSAGNGQVTVPPGFRFHPTDEELLYYYLRKKVAYEAIDLDVIRDVDLNKLEPWDLKEKCRIGSGPQNEWYFFSHKDKKYPTGTRTNRATMAGFWKATGRDKDIHLSNAKRIGMRKTLVFYIGRAPNGQKTEWIMHEYRLNEDNNPDRIQEDGWVVCRLFKKKIHQRELHQDHAMEDDRQFNHHMKINNNNDPSQLDPNFHHQIPWDYTMENSMQLPQLLSTESAAAFPFNPSNSLNVTDIECSQNLIKLMGAVGGGGGGTDHGESSGSLGLLHHERLNGDWSILDKLLASHQNLDEVIHGRGGGVQSQQIMNTGAEAVSSTHKFPFQYLGCEGGGKC